MNASSKDFDRFLGPEKFHIFFLANAHEIAGISTIFSERL